MLALTLSLAATAAAQPLSGPEFIPLATPCRALDTRVTGTPLQANMPRTIQIGGVTTGGTNCGVPTTAVGAALNFTVTQPQGPGHMAAWPSGALPQTAAVNFGAGEDVGNAMDIGLGAGGTVIVQSIVATHLVVDIYGYFTDVEELGNGNTALGAAPSPATPRASTTPPLGRPRPAEQHHGPLQHRHRVSSPPQQHHGRSEHRHGVLRPLHNTTGCFNTATGPAPSSTTPRATPTPPRGIAALTSNTTGNENTAAGANALPYNTTGTNNTATGVNALRNNTTGTDNTAMGSQALAQLTTGSNNTAIGIRRVQSDDGE